jgi:hypothetical protein
LRWYAPLVQKSASSNHCTSNVLALNHSSIALQRICWREMRVLLWSVQLDRNHCRCLPNGWRLRLCLLSPQVSCSRSPLTAGARKGLFCAVLPELSEGARILCPRTNERARDRGSSSGLCIVHRAQKGRMEEVSTPPLTPPPLSPQVFLNFLVGIWSGTDVEIAVIGPTASLPPRLQELFLCLLVRPPVWRCFWVAAGATFCLFVNVAR